MTSHFSEHQPIDHPYPLESKLFDGFENLLTYNRSYKPPSISQDELREKELDNRSILAKVQRMLAEHDERNDYKYPGSNAKVRSTKQGDSRKVSGSSVGCKRPPLTSIVTSNLPPPHCHSQHTSGIENHVEECFFPGLNTPEDILANEAASNATVDKLRHLADLLSPLRSRSSTTSSSQSKFQRPQEALSAGSQTLSYTSSSFGQPLQNFVSPHGNTSDPGPKERSGWNSVPVVSYRSAPTSPESFPAVPLRAWGLGHSHSYFELYKPENIRYPSVWDFSDIKSPVVRVNSSALHTNISMVWRKIEIAFAQEIWQWGNIFEQVLDRTLFKLSALSRNREYMTTKSQAVWKVHRYNLQELIKILGALYTKQFGQPVWATSDADIVKFLHTRDTCCSREMGGDVEEDYGAKDDVWSGKSIEISMKFGSGNAQVRRYMRQIVVDPSHIYATAGEDFELLLTLWDPHQAFEVLKSQTTFKLEPEIPWLYYSVDTHSFVGRVPANLGVFGEGLGAETGRLTHYKLELGLVAHIVDILPKGTERESTIRAKLNIWVQNNGHSVNSLFDDAQKTDTQVFFTIPPSNSLSCLETPEITTKTMDNEDSYDQGIPNQDYAMTNEEYGQLFSAEVMMTREAFVAAMLPNFWAKQSVSERPGCSFVEDDKPLFALPDDSFSNLISGEEFDDTGLDSWMENAMIAKLLDDKNEPGDRVERDFTVDSVTPSMLAMRNEFWDLTTETQEDKMLRLAPLHEDVKRASGRSGPFEEINLETPPEEIDSTSSAPYRLYRPVKNVRSYSDDGFLWKDGCHSFFNDLNLDSDTSMLATGGGQTPRSPSEYEYEDIEDSLECEFFESLGRCGPSLNM